MQEYIQGDFRRVCGRFSPLLDELNCGLTARDADGKLVYVNETLAEWLGYSRQELLGHTAADFVPPELAGIAELELEALKAGDIRARVTILQRKDSTTFPAVAIPQRIHDEDGTFRGSLAVIVDLGAVQTAKHVGYDSQHPVRESLDRIALELQSISMSAALPDTAAVPLEHPDLRDLSPREREVLGHLIAGQRVPTIASQLHISPHTVRNHLKAMYRKLDVKSQSQLIERVRALSSTL